MVEVEHGPDRQLRQVVLASLPRVVRLRVDCLVLLLAGDGLVQRPLLLVLDVALASLWSTPTCACLCAPRVSATAVTSFGTSLSRSVRNLRIPLPVGRVPPTV